MEKVITNQYGFKMPSLRTNLSANPFGYSEKLIQDDLVLSLRAKFLAFGIFLFFFFENGTLGLIPESYYVIYRSVRLSDLILYLLVIYSFFCIKEYIDLFKSKSFLIVKLFLLYLIIEFVISAFSYKFNVIEYFFRLKNVWTSFLIFPFLLLLKRNGLGFLIKLVFPVAVLANVLYILTALTGTAFLPDVIIVKQSQPGDFEIYRVFGGTFFGELFFLGFIYYWLTNRFKITMLFFVILFAIPHILAFGRTAWAFFIFSIILMIFINTWKKKKFKAFIRQAIIVSAAVFILALCFLKFIPQSEYYLQALSNRIVQGKEDIQYSEGTYAERTVYERKILLDLWSKNNPLVGIGMHPMWVYKAESREELMIYIALSDVRWPTVLALYGAIGFLLALIFQFYFIRASFKLIKLSEHGSLMFFFVIMIFCSLIFDTLINFSFGLVTIGIWGLASTLSFFTAIVIYCYEKLKGTIKDEKSAPNVPKRYYLYGRYSAYSYKIYKLKD
jgi:hypothetical protein